MAYIINNRTYTTHALLDEMIYNLDIIMENIEIKNDETALECETEQSLNDSDLYLLIMSGEISFYVYPFTQDLLVQFGYDVNTAGEYVDNINLIPEEDRDDLVKFCSDLFLESYSETNNYYRALIGLPWVEDDEAEDTYFVYIDESYITDSYLLNLGVFDFDLPVHEFSNYQIAIMLETGVMDTLYSEYPGKKYKYLHFLGDKKRELYDVRRASKWDILYMPSVETLVSDRFKELYKINREIFLHRFYSEAYQLSSDYYEEFMIIMLLCQTYTDMITDIPEWYIRRDIFDLRSCQYFLESHGIEYFKEIPLKYQIRIVKNMNKLIRYKSTNKNCYDILSIFDMEDTQVDKYWIFKKRLTDLNGDYVTGQGDNNYELEFVKAPIGDTYDSTIKDNIYRETYDDITLQDKYWDGEDTHSYIYAQHLAKDFTIEGTKFFSIENIISLSDYQFQSEYFMSLLLDGDLNIDDITISIPSISPLVTFPLSDLFMLLYCLTAEYEGYELTISTRDKTYTKTKPDFEPYDQYDGGYPSTTSTDFEIFGGTPETQNMYRRNVNGGLDPEYTEITQESFYDWLRWKYPYLWMDLRNRVNGFNLDADLDELAELIGFRHSSFNFERGYTLEELGVDGFMTADSVSSIEDLMTLYENNQTIYETVYNALTQPNSRDEKVVYEFVYNYLFTKSYDESKYTLSDGTVATSYVDLLKERNYILYNYYVDVTSDYDEEAKQDMIRQAMNEIIYTLEYYLDYDSVKYLFSAFSVSSFTAMLHYIYLMINFFKSFKVYLLDPYVTYEANDKLENTAYSVDNMGEVKTSTLHKNRFYQRDNTHVTVELNPTDDIKHNVDDDLTEVLDSYAYYEDDSLYDDDKDGGDISNDFWSSSTAEDEYDDVNGGFPDFTSYIPFHMLNGALVDRSLNMWDLYGQGVVEEDGYITVDGLGVDTRETFDEDVRYGFNVNGGYPWTTMMITSPMVVRVIDNQTDATVSVTTKRRDRDDLTLLELIADGFYIVGDTVNDDIVDTLTTNNNMGETLDRYRLFYNEYFELVVPHHENAIIFTDALMTALTEELDDKKQNMLITLKKELEESTSTVASQSLASWSKS